MGPGTCEHAVIQHQNLIGAANAGYALRNDEDGTLTSQGADRLSQMQISRKVKSTGRIIENQNGRVLDEGTGNGEPLLLAAERLRPFCSSMASRPPFLPSTTSFAWAVMRA